MDVNYTRSYLKIRIFGRDQGEAETQSGPFVNGIFDTHTQKYVEDLRQGLNAEIGRKNFFEMASNDKPGGYAYDSNVFLRKY